MKNRTAFFYIIIFLALLAVAGMVFLLAPGRDPETPAVLLPSSPPAETVTGTSGAPDGAEALAVTPETVQTVIATLRRAESYSRTLTVSDFWSGGSRSRTIEVRAHGDLLRLDIRTEGSSVQEHLLLRDGKRYLWYSDAAGVFSGEARDGDADAFQTIMTYEKVLTLPVSDILDAWYADYEGTPSIFVRFRSGSLGYESECRIDPATGLLMGERCYDGDELIYSMDSSVPTLSAPDDAVFAAP